MVFGFGKKKNLEFSYASIRMNRSFEVKNASAEELLEILKVRSKEAHNMTNIPSEVLDKIKQNVKSV